MTRVKVLAFLAVLALAVLLPATVLAQEVPPHRFFGTATIDGAYAPDGTVVTAVIEGAKVAEATTRRGNYVITIRQTEGRSYTGKRLAFTIKGFAAAETGTWAMGEVSKLNLTAVSGPGSIVITLAPLDKNLIRVWGLDETTQSWQLYDPAAPLLNDLVALVRGRGYWVKVNQAQTVTLGSGTYDLVAGWNLIGWLG